MKLLMSKMFDKINLFVIDNMRLEISLSAVLIACMVRSTYNLDCEQNQNGQSMSFFKTNGDLLLTGE
jgi:hypothetical protein